MSQNSSTSRSGPGCFGYGCLVATVLFCLVMGGVWFFGLRSLRSAMDLYTASSLEPLAAVEVDTTVRAEAVSKLSNLRAAIGQGNAYESEFSGQEIQALIDSTPWRDWLRVQLDGEDVLLTFAFPLSALGDWKAASFLVGDITDRALVGSARFRFGFAAGTPRLKFSELALNGKQLEDLPRGHAAEWILGAISYAGEDPDAASALPAELRGLREVLVANGRVKVSVGPR